MGAYDFHDDAENFKGEEFDFTPGGRPPRSPLPFILGGLAALLLVGVVVYSLLRSSLDGRAYQAAHAAYEAGDCASALPTYDQLLKAFRLADFSGKLRLARLERAECVPFQQAVNVETGDTPAASLLAWGDFLQAQPGSGLQKAARQRVNDLFARSSPSALASAESCAALKTLLANNVIPDLDMNLPILLFGCGMLAEKQPDLPMAEYYYETALSNNANHPLAPQIKAALASLIVDQARAADAPNLPPPTPSGDAASGSTVVIIQNDSPDALRIIFSGPQPLIEELPACADCVDFITKPPACPEKGAIGTYTLLPGDYDVVVESIENGNVTPFRGQWQLEDGIEFYSCFFIITNAVP